MTRKFLKQLFKNKDIRKRVLVVLALLMLYRVLAHVPIPVSDTQGLLAYLKQLFDGNQFLSFVDLFSGGAISRFSIVLVGLGAYINASIILQIAGQISSKLKSLQKDEGEQGRQKINQYTRYLTLPIAVLQSISVILLLQRAPQQAGAPNIIANPTTSEWFLMIVALTGGAMLMMWLGEIITEQGVGNGISLLITAGVIAEFPSQFGQIQQLVSGDNTQLFTVILFLLFVLGTIYALVKLNEAQRRLIVSYAKRVSGNQQYGGVETTLPIKLIVAGVIPVIFAVALLSVPGFLGNILINAKTSFVASAAQNLVTWYGSGQGNVYVVTYFILVVAFTFFSTGLYFNAKDIAENLQKQGGFIAGIRPGEQTANYLKKIVNRITLFGAFALGIIAIMPFILQQVTNSAVLTIGGVGLLIVVSVAIETMRTLEAQALTASYE